MAMLHNILLYLNALKIFVGWQWLYATQEKLFHRSIWRGIEKINYFIPMYTSTL